MAEPTSVATATLIMAGAAVPALTAFGVPLGLRADILLAGCAIAAAIALFTIGIGKEVYDRFTGGTVDVYDALATVWGGAVMLGWIEIAQAYA